MGAPPQDDASWASCIASIKTKIAAQSASTCQQDPSPTTICRAIDHTLLAECATADQVDAICAEADKYRFASVCVRVGHTARAAGHIRRANASGEKPKIGVTCVVGFPTGADRTAEKVAEAKQAVEAGATELDMVINYPLLLEGHYSAVYNDILAVRAAAPSSTSVLKVILETSQLKADDIIAASVISITADADFIKTSTGFKGSGATVEHVQLMHDVTNAMGGACEVKASGGVRSAEDCMKMMRAGATRIGASSGVKIMEQLEGKTSCEQGGQETY